MFRDVNSHWPVADAWPHRQDACCLKWLHLSPSSSCNLNRNGLYNVMQGWVFEKNRGSCGLFRCFRQAIPAHGNAERRAEYVVDSGGHLGSRSWLLWNCYFWQVTACPTGETSESKAPWSQVFGNKHCACSYYSWSLYTVRCLPLGLIIHNGGLHGTRRLLSFSQHLTRHLSLSAGRRALGEYSGLWIEVNFRVHRQQLPSE